MIKQIFSNDFYNLLNIIVNNICQCYKNIIPDSLIQTTITTGNTPYKNLNNQLYIDSINGLSIVQNSGGGDCFFIAVADAINSYNYNNQSNRIISGRFGTGTNLYTPLYLRILVYNFLQNWPSLDDQFVNSQIYANDLNDKFTIAINGLQSALRANGQSDNISPENYLDLATNVYMSNENFLINNVTKIPILVNDYERPFKIIQKSQAQLKNYIVSNNYWANAVAIYALCDQLKLNIIPISIEGNIISIPFANFNEDNGWDKYLFLYYSNSHFELITFTYKTNIPTIKNTVTIFNRTDFPPIYMLLTIFGANYSTINDSINKFNFTFKKEIMEIIANTIDVKLYDTLRGNYETDFYNIFKSYFPSSKIKQPEILQGLEGGGGGRNNQQYTPQYRPQYNQQYNQQYRPQYNQQYNQQYRPQYNQQYRPQYNQQYRPQYIESKMRKEENTDSSQLAYYITIYMELYPGTSIPPEEKANLKCKSKWNSVRKAYADFLGKPYIIPPVYNSNKTLKNNTKKNNIRPELQKQNTTTKKNA